MRPETEQPQAISPNDTAEVFMLHYAAMHSGNETLLSRVRRHLDAVVYQEVDFQAFSVEGNDAAILKAGLRHLRCAGSEWQQAQAALMLGEDDHQPKEELCAE